MSQITTHVLDTATGLPASNLAITLFAQQPDGQFIALNSGITNSDGRLPGLLADDVVLAEGTYKVLFETRAYHEAQQQDCFYPYAEVVFSIPGDGQHYHIPLLLSPYGYSTYRGS
ncbi:5-hydroxyisourate hydrolase [Sinobacterium caligoides]|uniref:5-hydroxyisourate hydrolase n=1 Tax=Sinobacterium caligoides TaxID=933926 RepID=A0A3N2E0K4_9GAMM|nr:hydroxyisourate hydrolase [Sinobacterium caligoides]ROS05640.1 5-hydroxyisourate hydrolase [Sinobacterium caligoides]